jgi:hypothetical protein
MSTTSIFKSFSINQEEYQKLEKEFGNLCHFVAWQLRRKNAKNNYTDELEDITQEIRIAILYAGAYYKRQTYLEQSLEVAQKHVTDVFLKEMLKQLSSLWKKRTRHGANKQKFGDYQEFLLEKIVKTHVPISKIPSKNRDLLIDKKFPRYCKAIAWNRQKNLGKKISKERAIRSGMVSLSEHDYLSAGEMDM